MNQDIIIRALVFLCVLAVLLSWEGLRPRRAAAAGKWPRRMNNLLLLVFNTAVLRLVMGLASVSAASLAAVNAWGLFHQLNPPYWLAFILSIVLLDLIVYVQHVVMHKIGFLWRLHRVHHTDKDLDATSALRFHPLEILLSMAIKLTVVVLLGVPVAAMLLFEVILNTTAMFNHGNIYIPVRLDRWLRLLVVTPDMHRVHHSVIQRETDSNYGFNLPWWDRLFGTYRPQPAAGHVGMEIGLLEFRDRDTVHVLQLLRQPALNIRRVVHNPV